MWNVFISVVILTFSFSALAQSNVDLNYNEIDKIEEVLETNFPRMEPSSGDEVINRPAPVQRQQKADFSSVDSTALFSDLVVFQKNYMPKSQRTHLSAGLVTVPTDVFYVTGGLSLKAAYHLSEAWGVEAFTNLLTSSPRQEVDHIASKQNVSVTNLVALSSFSGLNIYYNFIYGKLSVLDKKVVPFEIFNTLGVGSMVNTGQYQSASLQAGLGGLFSLSRSNALRLDLTWAFYQTKNIQNQSVSENSTFLSLGYSWFFPEPEYR